MNKEWRYFYHYNKPLSKRLGKTMWSVHFRGKCSMVENIACFTQAFSKTNKTQPFAVMQGFAKKVVVARDKTAIIK